MTRQQAEQNVATYFAIIEGKGVPADLVAATVKAIFDLVKE